MSPNQPCVHVNTDELLCCEPSYHAAVVLYLITVCTLIPSPVCAVLATLGFLVGELWHPLYDGKISGGLAALGQVPAAAWLQIVAAIGVIELTIGRQRDDLPPGQIGDFGQAFNPFADEPEKFEALQLKELKNGR